MRVFYLSLLLLLGGSTVYGQTAADDFIQLETISTDPVFDYLVWSDEFETPGPGPVDLTKWFHQTQLPLEGSWYNGEIQHYTDRIENAVVEDGVLKVIARRETFTDQGYTKAFTSARLNSKFAFQYGRVEISAKLPTGIGTWPALWMLGKNIDEDGGYWDILGFGTTPWPACGEIDIMEHWGDNQDYISSALHTPSSFGGTVNVGGRILPDASEKFHTYELIWTNERMIFRVDGLVHYTYQPAVRDAASWPFDAEQYFLFNVAMLPNVTSDFSESTMEVDYIRVYQESPVSSLQNSDSKGPVYYPNPVSNQLVISLDGGTGQELPISIYDLNGRTIVTQSATIIDGELRINQLEELPRGTYILTFPFEGEHHSIKFLKE
ncbi:MAG: family 16 glycosylhydrolase [Bacteroidota bacterium]